MTKDLPMQNNNVLRFGILIAFLWLFCITKSQAQDYINTRKVSLYRGDTSIVAGILSDVGIDKVEPEVYYYWYGHEQINANQGGYSGHLLDGEYLEYGPSGKLLLKGTYVKGKRTGQWISWYKAGAIRETREYEDGLLEGRTIRYSPDGRIIYSADCRHHILHGEMTTVLNDTLYMIKYKKGIEKRRVPLHVFDE
jgi:antitoxin component YwqK of YwqJK toxin-antitoxin module